jgi:hypothetical protein
MPSHARHVTPFSPAPIAVHDDRDMFREPSWIQLSVNFAFLAVEPRGYFVLQSGHPDMRLPQQGRLRNDRTGDATQGGLIWRGRPARAIHADYSKHVWASAVVTGRDIRRVKKQVGEGARTK